MNLPYSAASSIVGGTPGGLYLYAELGILVRESLECTHVG